MGTQAVTAAMMDAGVGVKHWTQIQLLEQHDEARDWPSIRDTLEGLEQRGLLDQLPAVIFRFSRRRGPQTPDTEGVARPFTDESLVASRIDPGVFPYDAATWYWDHHTPTISCLVIAQPYAPLAAAELNVSNVSGTFQQGEPVVSDNGVHAFVTTDWHQGDIAVGVSNGVMGVFEIDPLFWTEDGATATFLPDATITGQTSGATATIDGVERHVFRSLEDAERDLVWWFRLFGVERLRAAGVETSRIMPVPDASSMVSTPKGRYAASQVEVEMEMINQVGFVQRTIEEIYRTQRVKDDGETLIETTKVTETPY